MFQCYLALLLFGLSSTAMAIVGSAIQRQTIRSCTTALATHVVDYYSKIMAGASQNVPVGSITFTPTIDHPFKANAPIHCLRHTDRSLGYHYRCTGTFGSKCNLINSRKFSCRFISQDNNQTLTLQHHQKPAQHHTLPSQVVCDVCLRWPAETANRLKEETKSFFDHSIGKVHFKLINDPNGTACWT